MNVEDRQQQSRIPWLAVATAGLALACGQPAPSTDIVISAMLATSTGQATSIKVARAVGGTITSADGLVNCGLAGALCGDASGWTQFPMAATTMTLTATPDTARGWTFIQWVGDCTGTAPTCVVSTTANRHVGAVFRSPTVPPSAYRFGVSYKVYGYKTTGGTVFSNDGWYICGTGGSACTEFYPWATTAVFQAVPDAGNGFIGFAGDCSGDGLCSVTSGADKYIPGYFGALPAFGHPNWTDQKLHGPAYFDYLGGRPDARPCLTCHGANLQGQGIAPNCFSCHATAGWTGDWRANCSFCHGARDAAAKLGYAFSANPAWSAPPDSVAQRLDPAHAAVPSRTGAHQAHLKGVTAGGLSFAAPFACATCHAVPTNLTHIKGPANVVRAPVALSGAGQASLAPSLGTYDQASGTCTTWCHGTSPSPAWSATGLACGGCHALPPAPATGHPPVGPSLTGCHGCHGDTVAADGTIDLAGGKHIDGLVQASGGHGDYTSPAIHGPAFFETLRGNGDCRGCHGTTFGGGMGPSCNACHQAAGWTASWQTNCAFCHGTRSTESMTTSWTVTSRPALSAPPDTVAQRLGGPAEPAKVGAHAAHLTGRGSNGLAIATVPCGACHTVPADLVHAAGDGAAAVVLKGWGALPADLGSYTPATGSCATYCHGRYTGTFRWSGWDWGADAPAEYAFVFQGNSATVAWTDGPMTCASCHGAPPKGGGAWHSGMHGNAANYNECQLCHPDASSSGGGKNPTITNPAQHVNGQVELSPRWTSRCFGCH